MQAQELHGVARRSLDIEDYIDLLGRNKGWIFGPLFAMLVATVVGSYLWPDTFESEASLKIVSPTLDASISGGSPLNNQLSDRLSSMANTILSRTVLQTIIQEHNLYPDEIRRIPVEDVVENMKRKITISPAQTMTAPNGRGTISAFTIRFAYADRFKAQKVVGELVSRFINENQKEKIGGLTSGLRMALDRRDAAQKDLDQAETKLAAFRSAHQGRLPDQENAVMQQMTSLQTRLSLINNSMSRASQDKMMLDTSLKVEQEKRRSIVEKTEAEQTEGVEPERARSERLLVYEREIQKLEDAISALAESVTEKHPDLIAAKQRLAATAKQHELLLQKESSRPVAASRRKVQDRAAVRMAQEYDGNIQLFQTQIAAKALELDGLGKEAREVSSQIRSMSDRVQGIPLSEKEYAERQRDRDVAKEEFQQATANLAKMQRGYQLEDRMLGEGLEQLDSPRLPQSPSEPKRPLIIGLGALLGLFVGLVAVGAREIRDTSLKNLKDARTYTKATILASIPLIENELIVRRRRRIAWLGWSAGVLTGVALMAASVVYYYATKA